jgi:dihydrofolate reductase
MICTIFAMDRMGGIGLERDYPWTISDTYKKWFAHQVQDQILITGYNGWQLLVKHGMTPWARKTYVVSSRHINNNVSYILGDVVAEIKGIQHKNPNRDIYIAGGKALLDSTRHIADQIHIAHVNGHYRADTRIYPGYFLSGFQAISAGPSIDREYTFMTYQNLFPL